jgi:hypothetical protein
MVPVARYYGRHFYFYIPHAAHVECKVFSPPQQQQQQQQQQQLNLLDI